MLYDVFELSAPTTLIHAKRLVTAFTWQHVEARLDDTQQRPRCCFLQGKLNKRRRLSRIVLLGIDGVWMPGERKQSLRLHFLDNSLPSQVLVPRMRDLPARNLSRDEWVFEPNAEPLAELAVVGQRSPDAGNGRFEVDIFFDTISHAQPPGCPSI